MNGGSRASTWASEVIQSQDQISVRHASSHRISRRALTLILMLGTVICPASVLESGKILWYNLYSRTATRIQTEAGTWPEIVPLLMSSLFWIWGTWPKIMLKNPTTWDKVQCQAQVTCILRQSLFLVKVQAFDEGRRAGLSLLNPVWPVLGKASLLAGALWPLTLLRSLAPSPLMRLRCLCFRPSLWILLCGRSCSE